MYIDRLLYDEKAKSEIRPFMIIFIVSVAILIIFNIYIYNFHTNTFTGVVTEKEMTNNHSFIYIMTEEGENKVVECKIIPIRGIVDTTEMYGELEIGSTYNFETTGMRWEIFNEYEKITSFELIKESN